MPRLRECSRKQAPITYLYHRRSEHTVDYADRSSSFLRYHGSFETRPKLHGQLCSVSPEYPVLDGTGSWISIFRMFHPSSRRHKHSHSFLPPSSWQRYSMRRGREGFSLLEPEDSMGTIRNHQILNPPWLAGHLSRELSTGSVLLCRLRVC